MSRFNPGDTVIRRKDTPVTSKVPDYITPKDIVGTVVDYDDSSMDIRITLLEETYGRWGTIFPKGEIKSFCGENFEFYYNNVEDKEIIL